MLPVAWLAIAGLVGVLGAAAIVYNWDSILEWLHDFLPRVSKMIREIAKRFASDFEHFAYVIAEEIDNIDKKIVHVLYHRRHDGRWEEEKTTRTLPESELPAYAKKKLAEKRRGRIEEADITEELELELGQKIS